MESNLFKRLSSINAGKMRKSIVNRYSLITISTLVASFAHSQAFATLTPTLERGEQLIKIQEPGHTTEICVIPKRLNKAMYSPGDLQKEQELCSLVRGTNAAVCPKTSSTNPGLEFFKLPANTSTQEVEQRSCFIQNPTATAKVNILSKEAKYKYSTSCSYTPSILGYYHVSRILGGVGEVPPAVLRTFDLAEHKAIGEIALSKTTPDDTIYQTWSSYLHFIDQLPNGKKKDQLFTDNLDQSYGALQNSPSTEGMYSEFYNGGANQPLRYQNLMAKNPIFKTLTNGASLSNVITKDFTAANVQLMQQLRDMSDMIVIDTLLNQEDRLGNMDYSYRFAYLDFADRNPKNQPRLKYSKAPVGGSAVKIKKMVMRDNDCGVSRENHARAFKLVDKIAHISPLTYKRLLMFNQQADQPAVKQLFTLGMVFTADDYASVRSNLSYAAKVLQANCQSGKLKLDLDAESHFAGQVPAQECNI